MNLGGENQIKASRRDRLFVAVPPNGFATSSPVGHPHLNVFLIFAHPARRALMDKITGDESRWGIALAERFQPPEGGQAFQAQLFQAAFRLNSKGRPEQVNRKLLTGHLIQALAQ
jgi:hypothetical protein